MARRRGGWLYILGRVPEVRLERETGSLLSDRCWTVPRNLDVFDIQAVSTILVEIPSCYSLSRPVVKNLTVIY